MSGNSYYLSKVEATAMRQALGFIKEAHTTLRAAIPLLPELAQVEAKRQLAMWVERDKNGYFSRAGAVKNPYGNPDAVWYYTHEIMRFARTMEDQLTPVLARAA